MSAIEREIEVPNGKMVYGLGAIVSSSRAITYACPDENLTSRSFAKCVRENTVRMIDDITKALAAPARAG
jgi:hypothetical protein